MDEQVRQRRLRRLLRVTFPDGKVLCYKSATMTFVEALQMISTDKLSEVKLESYHLPLISQEVYPRFKEWMKPIKDGWYVNVQSDSDQKYMQLVSIMMSDDMVSDHGLNAGQMVREAAKLIQGGGGGQL